MTQEAKVPERSTGSTAPAAQDLSAAIAHAVETQADEEAAVVRVFDDRYRCNWWVRDRTNHWLSGTTGTIRRSKFLRATQTAGGLVIEDLNDRR